MIVFKLGCVVRHLHLVMHVVVQENDQSMAHYELEGTEEAKDTMQVCMSEFTSFIISKANERCQKEHH
ncbi:hypothetical protein CR513_60959, partial [Mucuna pruriens]